MTQPSLYNVHLLSPSSRRAYVTEQLATIIGRPVAPTDMQVERWWRLLSREEERESERDKHGNFPLEASQLARLGLLEAPPLNDDVLALAGERRIACWPSPYRFAACLTHDVDVVTAHPWRERLRRLFDTRIPATWIQRGRWALGALTYACYHREHSPYEEWMAEEARHGFHSTFFVLPESYVCPTAYDHYHLHEDPIRYFGTRMTYAEATRRVRAAGWEIGLHGSYASAHDTDILRVEKAALEAMLGAEVQSTRQHYLRFEIALTPSVWADAGLRADSTMGCIRAIGYRSGLAFPYFWPGDGDILEVPLALHDISLFRVPKCGASAPLPRQEALARAQALIARIAAVGGVVTLSWHTHPDYPGALAAYRALLQTIAELGGWGCTVGELNAWWRARRAAVRHPDSCAGKYTPTNQEVNNVS